MVEQSKYYNFTKYHVLAVFLVTHGIITALQPCLWPFVYLMVSVWFRVMKLSIVRNRHLNLTHCQYYSKHIPTSHALILKVARYQVDRFWFCFSLLFVTVNRIPTITLFQYSWQINGWKGTDSFMHEKYFNQKTGTFCLKTGRIFRFILLFCLSTRKCLHTLMLKNISRTVHCSTSIQSLSERSVLAALHFVF